MTRREINGMQVKFKLRAWDETDYETTMNSITRTVTRTDSGTYRIQCAPDQDSPDSKARIYAVKQFRLADHNEYVAWHTANGGVDELGPIQPYEE